MAKWIEAVGPSIGPDVIDTAAARRVIEQLAAVKKRAADLLGEAVPARPPGSASAARSVPCSRR